MAKITIIDDEEQMLRMMTKLCDRLGHDTAGFQTGTEGLKHIHKSRPDVLIVDLKIGDIDGLEIIKECSGKYPAMAIIMVTGFSTVETAVEAMKLGAFDYLSKPFEITDLQKTIARALSGGVPVRARPAEISATSEQDADGSDEGLLPASPLIGGSDAMKRIQHWIQKFADLDRPVSIEGEFATGKELVARVLHDSGKRSDLDFQVVRCDGEEEAALERKLFGDPDTGRDSVFTKVNGGTVVLKEVLLLPMRLQAQLASFLVDVEVRRQAGRLRDNLNFRLVVTSTKQLGDAVDSGTLLRDLYYQLAVIPIQTPSLRNRPEDIPLLANHFLERFKTMSGMKSLEIDKFATRSLMKYSWPGNVSELENAIDRACAFCEDKKIRPSDLPPKVSQTIEITEDDAVVMKTQLPVGMSLAEFTRKQETMFIQATLDYNEGSRETTATMLGVSIATLYRKMDSKAQRKEKMQLD